MSQTDYQWDIDAYRSWAVGIAAKREQAIRAGLITPRDEQEREWARQGPVPVNELESGK